MKRGVKRREWIMMKITNVEPHKQLNLCLRRGWYPANWEYTRGKIHLRLLDYRFFWQRLRFPGIVQLSLTKDGSSIPIVYTIEEKKTDDISKQFTRKMQFKPTSRGYMVVWEMQPAMEPATNRSYMPKSRVGEPDRMYCLSCSYAMNLMADSGAIFITLIPLPRHKLLTPPSWSMWRAQAAKDPNLPIPCT